MPKKNILRDLFLVQHCHNYKKHHPSENLKFNNFGIFQSIKLRILVRKILQIFSLAKFHFKYFGLLWVKLFFVSSFVMWVF